MALFLITPINDPDMTLAQIKEQFPSLHYEIPRTHSVFVVFKGTTKELSDKIGLGDNALATGVVTAVSNYYGRAPTDMWEWIQSRMDT